MPTKLERMKVIEDRMDVLEKEDRELSNTLNNNSSNETVNRYETIYTEIFSLSKEYFKLVFDKE